MEGFPNASALCRLWNLQPYKLFKNAFLRRGFRHTWQKANPISNCLSNPGCQRAQCSLQGGLEPLFSWVRGPVWFCSSSLRCPSLWGQQMGARVDIGPATRGTDALGLAAEGWYVRASRSLSQDLFTFHFSAHSSAFPSLLPFPFLPLPFLTFSSLFPPFPLFPFKKWI